MKNLELPAMKALQEFDERTASPRNLVSQSPMFEFTRRIDEQNRRFNEHFSGIAKNLSLAMPSYMTKIDQLTKGLTPFVEQFARLHDPLQEMMKRIQLQSQPLYDLANQFNTFQARLNFPELNNSFRGLTDVIRNFPREQIIQIRLHSEYWLIVDESLLASLAAQGLFQNEEAVQYVIDYYKADDWRRLKEIVEAWRPYVSSQRIEIFEHAIAITNENQDAKIHFFTVPTLIAQVDGLVRELITLMPRTTKKRIEKQIREKLPPELKDKRVDVRQDVAIQTIAEIVDYWSAEILQDIIFSGLFRDSNQITSDESYSLFRHKIMHGDKEFLRYNNEENFIRLMLYADFIVDLIRQIQKGTIVVDQAA